MRLFVCGATGRTGGEVVDLALGRGHAVTAFVRSPGKLGPPRPGLTVVEGDPTSASAMAAALAGHDAVVSALGLPARQALRPSAAMTGFAAATVAAMTASGVSRLGVVSAAVLFPEPSGFPYSLARWVLRHHADDLRTMEALIAASDLAWTVARPPRLVRGASTGYRARVGGLPERGVTATFRSVAAFLVDAIEQASYVRAIAGVAA